MPTGKGKQLACTITDQDGRYSLGLGYSGEVIIEAIGGTYTDEGSGALNVPLTFPLNVAGIVSTGTQTLVATPLTSRAFSLLVAKNELTVAAFDDEAARIAADAGLVVNTRLSGVLPIVTAGQTNAYGDVLIGLAKSLSPGAMASFSAVDVNLTIHGTWVASGFFGGSLEHCTRLGIVVGDFGEVADGVAFTVIQPTPSWYALLPEPGPVMGCALTLKTAARVDMTCPTSALTSGYTLIGYGAISPVPEALPSSGVLVAGRFIAGVGRLSAAGSGILDASYVNAGGLSAIPGSGLGAEQYVCGTPGGLSYVYGAEAFRRTVPDSLIRVPPLLQ